MSQLDTWAKGWADLEKRNAQTFDELTRQVDAMAKEHAQCAQREKEIEQRSQAEVARHATESGTLQKRIAEIEPYVQTSKDAQAKCAVLEQKLGTSQTALEEKRRECTTLDERSKQLGTDLDKLKDHMARSQEATREATAREADWKRRYHEDTGKLMQQLTVKNQECERVQAESQQRQAEVERTTRELRGKDEIVQTLSKQFSEYEQRCATQQDAIQEKESNIAELMREIAELQKALEAERAINAEQSALVDAAHGVLAELQPKMQLLERKLGKH
jgi:chromosome segregation ATPase